jgi:hypothetical protein
MTVMGTHRKFSHKSSMTFCVLVLIKEPGEICYERNRGIREESYFFWVHTRKNSTIASGATTIGSVGRAPDDIIKKAIIWWLKKRQFIWAYTRNTFSTIASGATPIGSASHAPDDIFTCIKRAKKAKEELDSVITTIGREFILVKVETTRRFSELK